MYVYITGLIQLSFQVLLIYISILNRGDSVLLFFVIGTSMQIFCEQLWEKENNDVNRKNKMFSLITITFNSL